MHGYIWTDSRLKRENLRALGSQQMGLYFLCPQYPTAGDHLGRLQKRDIELKSVIRQK